MISHIKVRLITKSQEGLSRPCVRKKISKYVHFIHKVYFGVFQAIDSFLVPRCKGISPNIHWRIKVSS